MCQQKTEILVLKLLHIVHAASLLFLWRLVPIWCNIVIVEVKSWRWCKIFIVALASWQAGIVVFMLHDKLVWLFLSFMIYGQSARVRCCSHLLGMRAVGCFTISGKSWPPFPDTNHSQRSSVQVQRALENNNKKIERGMLLHKAKWQAISQYADDIGVTPFLISLKS
jgi:hypothetical protein